MKHNMRLIHTADIHLDACFAGLGLPFGIGDRRREALRAALRRIAERAGAWPADALLIAGNLFEKSRVTRDTLGFLARTFAAIPHVPVYIAPGNLDPYTADSPYATFPWPGNVQVFAAPDWSRFDHPENELAIHGFGFTGPEFAAPPFGKLAVPADGRVHVAVAHGVERRFAAHRKATGVFDAARAAAPGLAYLALGGHHAVEALRTEPPCVMYYSGAPEGRSFDEPGPRHYLEVVVEHGRATVTPVVSSETEFFEHEIDCSAFSTVHQVVGALRELADEGGGRIARVTLRGTAPGALAAEWDSVYDAAAPGFETLDLVDATTPADDFDQIAAADTTMGAVIRLLNEEVNDAPDAARRAIAARARQLSLAAFQSVSLPIPGKDRG